MPQTLKSASSFTNYPLYIGPLVAALCQSHHLLAMDIDVQLEGLGNHKGSQWLLLVQAKWAEIPAWVTQYHPAALPCSLEQRILHGSYNLGLIAVFSNGEKWFIRFPLVGRTGDQYLDLKVANEVKTLRLLRERTDIPVPDVKAWGLADQNRLGLGPFIIEQFIEGERLKPILSVSDEAEDHILGDELDDRRHQTGGFSICSLSFVRVAKVE